MTIRPRQSTAATLLSHRLLVGLTFFHAVIIAMAGPVLGKQLEFTFRALFDDDSALHIMGESLVVALLGTLAYWRQVGRTMQATFVHGLHQAILKVTLVPR